MKFGKSSKICRGSRMSSSLGVWRWRRLEQAAALLGPWFGSCWRLCQPQWGLCSHPRQPPASARRTPLISTASHRCCFPVCSSFLNSPSFKVLRSHSPWSLSRGEWASHLSYSLPLIKFYFFWWAFSFLFLYVWMFVYTHLLYLGVIDIQKNCMHLMYTS